MENVREQFTHVREGARGSQSGNPQLGNNFKLITVRELIYIYSGNALVAYIYDHQTSKRCWC